MKILIPADTKNPEDSPSRVFGRSKYFAIYDTDTEEIKYIKNPGNQKARGAGMSASQIAIDQGVEKVVAERIGPNAKDVLDQGGIQTEIKSVENQSIKELFKSE